MADHPSIIETQEIRLVDSTGTLRGLFTALDGNARLDLRDQQGREGIVFAVESEPQCITSLRPDAKVLVGLSVSSDHSVGMDICDRERNVRFHIVCHESGAEFTVFDEAMNPVWRTPRS